MSESNIDLPEISFHETTYLAMESMFTREASCRLSIKSVQSNMLIYI